MERETAGWQEKLNNGLSKVWTKTTGSKWDKVNPMIKCEFQFKETNEPQHVFESVSSINQSEI